MHERSCPQPIQLFNLVRGLAVPPTPGPSMSFTPTGSTFEENRLGAAFHLLLPALRVAYKDPD